MREVIAARVSRTAALDAVDPAIAQDAIAGHLRRVKPQVVITFGPEGAYGHPDHIAISQLTTAAVVRAADRDYAVSKLYYIAWSAQTWAAYQAALKKLTSTVDGVERQVVPAPDWEITTRIDTSAVWPTVLARRAVPPDADERLQEPRRRCRRSTIARCGACRSSIARSAS